MPIEVPAWEDTKAQGPAWDETKDAEAPAWNTTQAFAESALASSPKPATSGGTHRFFSLLRSLDEPLVKLPEVATRSPLLALVAPEFEKGLAQGARETIESLTTPTNLGVGAALTATSIVAPPVGLALIGGLGAKGLGQSLGTVAVAAQQGDVAGVGRQVAPVIASGLMIAAPVASVLAPKATVALETARTELPKAAKIEPEQVLAPPVIEPPSPPPASPPAPVAVAPASVPPRIEVLRRAEDYNVFNNINSGQFAFSFGRLGETAKAAWEKLSQGEMEMRESIARDVQDTVKGPLESLPRELRKSSGEAFFEILDGKSVEEVRSAWADKSGGSEVIAAAEQVKNFLEEARITVRETKKAQYQNYLESLDKPSLEQLYENTFGIRPEQSTKLDLADALATESYPVDWGISDGSYIPHMFAGSFKITARSGDKVSFINRALTPEEAKVKIRDAVEANPELAEASFVVEPDIAIPSDIVRLSDPKFFRLVAQMKEQLGVPASEIRLAQRGVVGRTASKQKWWGSLQERKGAEGYSKDFEKVLSSYIYGFHRWRVLNRVQNEVAPLLDQIRGEGRFNAANRLTDLLENLWGKPARSTLEFDALLQKVPVLRDRIEPLALDRWTRGFRGVTAALHLTTPRFAVVNRLQPLQGLWPLIGSRLMLQAKLLQHSKEGAALLDKHGVKFDAGQYGEVGLKSKLGSLRERVTGEKSNQELAFLGTYLHGRSLGLAEAEAASYAKLRGQLMTQFMPLITDTPKFMEGPILSTVFQYRRFPIKQLELIATLVREGNLSGLSRMFAAFALTGGLAFFMRQGFVSGDKQLSLKKELEQELGPDTTDFVWYGLPGFLNADLSGSLALVEKPLGENIYEKIGRTVTGPGVASALQITSDLLKEERQPTTAGDKALVELRRIPALKPLAEAVALLNEDYDVTTPDGETAYKRKVADVIVSMGAFRSKNESNMRMAVDAVVNLKREQNSLKNAFYVASQTGDTRQALEDIQAFNKRWPEVAMDADELQRYIASRQRNASKTDIERLTGKKFERLMPQP